jgi:hypothetical protein
LDGTEITREPPIARFETVDEGPFGVDAALVFTPQEKAGALYLGPVKK